MTGVTPAEGVSALTLLNARITRRKNDDAGEFGLAIPSGMEDSSRIEIP
jgi:hypothetical protein